MLMRGTKRSSLVGPVKGGALELGRSGTRTTAECLIVRRSTQREARAETGRANTLHSAFYRHSNKGMV